MSARKLEVGMHVQVVTYRMADDISEPEFIEAN
jgi:hypothetical protein